MKEEFIRVEKINKSFFGVKALQDVDMTIKKGEAYCLAGENGSGKSTLIKIIAGVYRPNSGRIYVNGKEVVEMTPKRSMKLGIQIIYQDFSLFPNLSVAENIAYYNQIVDRKKIVHWDAIAKIAKDALKQLDITMDIKKKVSELSVAQKQIVAICRALTQEAKLIIMDEPTSTLTKVEIEALYKIIENLKSKGISILFISHKLDEVFEVSEKIIILRNGKKVAEGKISEFDNNAVIYHMTGREISKEHFIYDKEKPQVLMSVKGLSKNEAFKDISFELHKGEILGVTGLLGSGRTELANALFGINPAEKGDIFIKDKKVKITSVKDAIKNKIGYVPEDRLTEGLFLERSIGNNIIATIIKRFKRKFSLLATKDIEKEINKWMTELKIKSPSSQLPVRSLSGGNQQRVVIARWLATHPLILILNCPTVGVDVGSKQDIHNIIRELAKSDIGIIVISDDIPELLQTCNRVLIMKRGEICEAVECLGTSEEVIQDILLEAN